MLDEVNIQGAPVDSLCVTFVYPKNDHIDLTDDGSNTYVTLERTQDYVDLVLHQAFHESVKIQVQAFRRGFNSIFPISSLQPFAQQGSSQEELELLVCGMPCTGAADHEWTNSEEQARFIEPDHGYTRSSA